MEKIRPGVPPIASTESTEVHFEGNREVLNRLWKKKRLMEAGEPHEHIRPLLLILGGSLRGVFGGGAVTALEKAGLRDVFDVVVGTSTGAPTAAYFCAGQAELGTSIYYEECVKHPFFSWLRYPFADVDYLRRVFSGRDGGKGVDQEAIQASRSQLYIAVTDQKTVRQEFLNAKEMDDVSEALQASITVPLLSSDHYELGGRNFIDGSIGNPFPIEAVLRRFSPTDVVILANCSRAFVARGSTYAEKIIYGAAQLLISNREFLKIALSRHLFAKSLAWLRKQGKQAPYRWLVEWGDDSVHVITSDAAVLRAAVEKSEALFTRGLEDAATGLEGTS